MSFADPREGDLEDDASSTSHHSLLRHASRMLLEISLPKLVLAALLLLVVPAFFVGVAPKLVAWFAQAAWHRISEPGRVVSLLAFAGISGFVAWRWGRLLFALVEQNFWALNAGLVQPLYMTLREGMRLAFEKFSGDRHLARRAGLVAGAVMSIGAAAVAWWAGPLPVLLSDHATLAQSAQQSLANGVWVVAVYLMLAAPAWAVAEALAGQPDDIPILPDPATAQWRIAHLSDVHTVGEAHGFRLESGRDGPCGNARFDQVLGILQAEDAARPLDWVLVTGDITDAGRNAEFIAFEDALAAAPTLRERVLVLPGNHDVNIVDRANPARLELPWSVGGALRRARMLGAMLRLQGHRVHVVDGRTRQVGATLHDFLATTGRGATVARFMDRGGILAGHRVRAIWRDAFPMVVPPSEPDGLGVLLLDSNAETHFSFTNALGLVALEQMREAEGAMRQYPQARWLVALHHHVVEYPRLGVPFADRIGTALVNGHWVLRRLRRHARRSIVLHGHRHFDWMGTSGGLRILSAPSPVMGGRDDEARYFHIHALDRGADGALDWRGTTTVPIPGLRA